MRDVRLDVRFRAGFTTVQDCIDFFFKNITILTKKKNVEDKKELKSRLNLKVHLFLHNQDILFSV